MQPKGVGRELGLGVRTSKSFGRTSRQAQLPLVKWYDVSVHMTLSLDTSKSELETGLLQKETLVVPP